MLTKVKQKTAISLPGWDAAEVVVVSDTPSQMSQVFQSLSNIRCKFVTLMIYESDTILEYQNNLGQ